MSRPFAFAPFPVESPVNALLCAARLLAAAALLAGCDQATASRGADVLPPLAPGLHPVVAVTGRQGDTTTLELRLARVGTAEQVAAYQGELAFDPAALRLAGADVPPGVAGAWNPVAPGRLRFAGAALQGIGDGPMLVVRVVAAGEVEAEMLTLTVDEVTAARFHPLTDQVRPREHPVLLRGGEGR